MPTVSLDAFVPQINPHVVGCPDGVLKNALLTAATEFCTRTLSWQVRQAPVATSATSYPYSIPLPAHATLARVLAVHVDTSKLKPTSYEALDQSYDWDTRTGNPSHFLVEANSTLVVFPLPAAPMDLRITAACTVARDATVLEDFLYTTWRDALVAGALYNLTSQPKRAWSDSTQAQTHLLQFERGIHAARTEVRTNGKTLGELCVSSRPIA